MIATKTRDTDYEKLHDKDPIDYHAKLARLHITCGFCENRKKKALDK